MVAVTMERLGEALAGLDSESHALLDLNVRRGLPEAEIADILKVEPAELFARRQRLFDRLAQELGLETREERDELQATLPDLPAWVWKRG